MSRSKDNQPQVAPPSPSTGRRRLLGWLWGGCLLALLGEIIWLISSFLRPRTAPAAAASALFVAGPVDAFSPGSVTAFARQRFYLSRLEDGGFLALLPECTHLGCSLPWSVSERRFTCPCHASSFDITGEVLAPPATRPLDLLTVRIENGLVKVDLDRPRRRSEYRSSQAVPA
jgi:nitrite reductase/ring-hydroxylating ferredoxin subunit